MNTLNKLIIVLLVSFGMAMGCKDKVEESPVSEEITETVTEKGTVFLLPPSEFSEEISGKTQIQLIDVRTPEEVAQGTIPGAVNIDFRASDFEARIQELDKDKAVYLFCRSGGRSGNAAKLMQEMGFTAVYDLDGGVIAWSESGRELAK